MRRRLFYIVTALLVLALALSAMAGCSGRKSEKKDKETETATPPAVKPTPDPEGELPTVVLYENDYVRIIASDFAYYEDEDNYCVRYLYENKCDYTLYLLVDYYLYNGYSYNDHDDNIIDPNGSYSRYLYYDDDLIAFSGYSDIKNVSGSVTLVNFDTEEELGTYTFSKNIDDTYKKLDRKKSDSECVIFDQDGIKITKVYDSIVGDQLGEEYAMYVWYLVENGTDKKIEVNSDSHYINNWEEYGGVFCDVPAGLSSFVYSEIFWFNLEDMGFTGKISDYSYDMTFCVSVYDEESGTIAEEVPCSLKIDNKGKPYFVPEIPEGEQYKSIYSEGSVKVSFGIVYDALFDDYSLVSYVGNGTDSHISAAFENITVNGIPSEYDSTYNGVKAHSNSCKTSMITFDHIDSLESVSFDVTVEKDETVIKTEKISLSGSDIVLIKARNDND